MLHILVGHANRLSSGYFSPAITCKHLHKPLTKVPDPFGKFKSFGEHNNQMLKNFLDKFNFEYNFKSSTKLYTSGFFNSSLQIILENYIKMLNDAEKTFPRSAYFHRRYKKINEISLNHAEFTQSCLKPAYIRIDPNKFA